MVNAEQDATHATRPQPEPGVGADPGSNADPLLTVKARHATLEEDGEPTAMIRSDSKTQPLAVAHSSASTPRAFPLRTGMRMSLPSAKILEAGDQKRHHHHEADEDKERHEYEIKAQHVFP
jgi:hypothetical protein